MNARNAGKIAAKTTAQQEKEIEQKAAIAAEIDLSNPMNGTLTLSFKGGEQLKLRADMLTPEIATQAMFHGLKQKLVDAAAISRDPETGRAATLETKREAVRRVFDRITGANGQEPSWNAVRGDGSGTASGGLLFAALCRLYPKRTVESLREYLAGKSDAEKAALRKNPRVAEIIETIKAERAKDDGEEPAKDLLAELDEMDEGGGVIP